MQTVVAVRLRLWLGAMIIIWVVIAGQGVVAGEDVEKPSPKRSETIHWQTTIGTASRANIWNEFADLYEWLFNLALAGVELPVRTLEAEQTKCSTAKGKEQCPTVADLIKPEGLYYGATGIPDSLDRLLCYLNMPKSCRLIPGLSLRDTPGSTHPDVKPAQRTWWTFANGQLLVVPNLQFEEIILNKPYRKKKGDSIERIVIKDRLGCTDWDDDCRAYVRKLNGGDERILGRDYEGEIIVPTQGYRAAIQVKNTGALIDATPAATVALPTDGAVPKPLKSILTTGQSDLTANAPLRSIVLPAEGRTKSSHGVTAAAADLLSHNRQNLLRSTNHPGHTSGDGRVVVGVFDRWVHVAHCNFSADKVMVESHLTSPKLPVAQCGELRAPVPPLDHGTHIVGIIAAKRDAAGGMGIAPDALVRTDEIHPERFGDEAMQSYVARKITGLPGRALNPQVVNMSFEYALTAPVHDPIEQAIASLKKSTLVVAAAGGDPGRHYRRGDACGVRPACLGFPHLLSVVAVSKESGRWAVTEESNWGDSFDVAAPGYAIQSTLAGNALGVLSGTSQATASVSGAAALVYSQVGQARPYLVRDRIIYTADFVAELENKVWGGLINIGRAVELGHDILVFRNERGEEVTLFGEMVSKEPVQFFDNSQNQPACAVRRLTRKPNNEFVMFYIRDCGGGPGRLLRSTGFLARNGIIRFVGAPTRDGMRVPTEVEYHRLIDLTVRTPDM